MSASPVRRRFITRAHGISLARAKIFTQNGGSGSFPRGGGNKDDGRSLVDTEECINDASGDEEKTPRVRVPLRRRVRLVFPTVVVVLSPAVAILALLFSLVVCARKSARRSAQ